MILPEQGSQRKRRRRKTKTPRKQRNQPTFVLADPVTVSSNSLIHIFRLSAVPKYFRDVSITLIGPSLCFRLLFRFSTSVSSSGWDEIKADTTSEKLPFAEQNTKIGAEWKAFSDQQKAPFLKLAQVASCFV